MLGYSADELEPHVKTWEASLHPDDMPRVMKALGSHLKGETLTYECEHRLKRKDGSWLWVMDKGRVVQRDSENRPLRALGIHVDISEQRTARVAKKNPRAAERR